MIAYIRGELIEKQESSVVVDVNGIGYELMVPNTTISRLPKCGEEIELYTYLQVKEDITALFGFDSKNDLRLFKLLITVNGIGPKGALAILSSMSSNDLMFAVLSDDAKTIARTPGIGIKTAGKLILDLKDKFSLTEVFEERITDRGSDEGAVNTGTGGIDVRNETVQALVALGYTSTEAMKAVKGVENAENMTSEELLKYSLKKMI